MDAGVMETIRGLLSGGRSSREIIQLGYAPRTVYAVQRDLRRKVYSARSENIPSPGASQERELNSLKSRVKALEAREVEREAMSVAIQERPADPCPTCGGKAHAMKIRVPDEVRKYMGPASESEGEKVGDSRDPDEANESRVNGGEKKKDGESATGWFPFRVPFFDD